MNSSRNDSQDRVQLARALTAVKHLRSQLDALQRARSEPIAIVGLGCRYPGGVHDDAGFWQLLCEGRDAIGEVPADRWDVDAYYAVDPAARGKISTRFGGFLDRLDEFDPQFFGISPREAVSLDPQQRLLLEVAWQALEHAGLAPDSLRGSQTGVFVGISGNDYAQLLLAGGPQGIDSYMGSGTAHSVAAGRLSYVFGFEGPSLAVDTACSSSLVAVHLACQSLRQGECELALAGGVNVLLAPAVSINHSRARMLAPDGRCKAFDAAADGFVRAEGCGLVVLKPLGRALANGDPVLAVIRGSAINQDGHTSGLTVPSGPSQQKVIRRALEFAGLDPADVGYVEAHGTGTALGDPIELQALAEVFAGPQRERLPLLVGSVKTNFGHAEAAAGVAGLIKVMLSLQHEAIAPHLHLREPNPRIDWERMPLAVPTTARSWPRGTAPRFAGVSSFGFGGTNAFLVVEEAPPLLSRTAAPERPLHLLALSAHSEESLHALAGRYATYLTRPEAEPLGDVCHSAGAGRAQLRHRLCVTAATGSELAAQLDAFTTGRATPGLVHGKAGAVRPQVAFLCTGQGAQYAGMARGLYETQPTFRRDLERCAALLAPHLDRPLLELLYPNRTNDAGDADSLLDRTEYTQPALFALEVCLGRLWMAWGVTPDLLFGHSLGEYSAACLAGVFSLEDGLRLVALRGRLMQRLPEGGAMAAVLATESEVRTAIAKLAPAVEIAAINGPGHVVVSGASPGVAILLRHFSAIGVATRPLKVSHAFHSPLIVPMLADFQRVASDIEYSAPRFDLVSNLSGEIAGDEVMRADYWCRHARQPVRFFEGMCTLARQGVDVYLEIGPEPMLLGMGRRCVASQGAWLPSLHRGADDWQTMLAALTTLQMRGAAIDWRGFDAGYERRRVRLPAYPFERQRYWIAAPGEPRPPGDGLHPLLGARQDRACQPDPAVWQNELVRGEVRLLDDHRVFGMPMMPGSGYVELALAAGSALGLSRIQVEALAFHQPLVLGQRALAVQTALLPTASGSYSLQVHSRAAGDGWVLHASAIVRADADPDMGVVCEDLAALRARSGEALAPAELYDAYAQHGVEFGPALRAVGQLWRGEREALGCLRLPDDTASDGAYRLHPVWLDAAAQVLGAAAPESETVWLQAGIERVRVHRVPVGATWAHACVRSAAGAAVRVADLRLLDEHGEVLVEVTGLQARPVDPARLGRGAAALRPVRSGYHELRWVEQPRPPRVFVPTSTATVAEIAAELRPQLDQAAADPRIVEYAGALAALDARAPVHVAAALRRLGWRYDAGSVFSTDAAQQTLGIAPGHRRLLERLLAMLTRRGTLRRQETQWAVTAGLPADDPHVAAAVCAAAPAEAGLFERCGAALADVLAGRCDPLQLLFAGGASEAAAIYSDSPGAAAMHGLLRGAVAALRRSWPTGRPLRVIEIGAGTGGATAHVLPELPPQTEYVYTDMSRGFFTAARARFSGTPFIRYETLDIERPPQTQGYDGREFDLVIAFNVLHATRSVADSVAHARSLLAPGGLFLLLENTEPADWVDLIWGLTPGWWRFEDTGLRPAHPLLNAGQWRELLAASGFAAVESLQADPARHPVMSRQALLVARNAEPRATAQRRSWLLLADAGGVGRALARQLEARGDHALLACREDRREPVDADEIALDPLAKDDFARVIAAATALAPLAGVAHLWGLDASAGDGLAADALAAESLALSASALHLTQALVSAAPAADAALWIVTRNARPAGDCCETLALGAATLCGIGQTIAREHPQRWGGLLDLDGRSVSDAASLILDELCTPDGEDQIAWRADRRLVARIVSGERAAGPAVPVRGDNSTYLISGGCGALGLQMARWLVEQGGRRLALLGRSGAVTSEARQAIAELERRGAQVQVFRADIADEAALRQVLAEIGAAGMMLRGIVHAAGLPGRCALAELDTPALEGMFAAKVAGSWALHRATRDLELDFFVCCSSMVSLWGAREQGHYVAANHFVDALAHYRRSLGLPALSVNWGPLSGGGMLPAADVAELARIGVFATPLVEAPSALAHLLATQAVQAAPVHIDWPLFRAVYQTRGRCRLFDQVAIAPSTAPRTAPVLDQLRSAAQSERREILVEHVQTTLARVLGLDASRRPDAQQGFFDIGMDSLTAMELCTQLQDSLGATLPSTLAFDYGTVDALVDFLLRSTFAQPQALPAAPARDAGTTDTGAGGAIGLDGIARMTDAEVEILLLAKLNDPVRV